MKCIAQDCKLEGVVPYGGKYVCWKHLPKIQVGALIGKKAYTSLHCDNGDHNRCFWTGKPATSYPERVHCECPCHGQAVIDLNRLNHQIHLLEQGLTAAGEELAEAYSKIAKLESVTSNGQIGVHDNTSLIACLVANYEQVFPGSPSTDAQDMIQRMAAEIMTLRRF